MSLRAVYLRRGINTGAWLLAMVSLLVLGSSTAVFGATQSRLRQEIKPLDCTLTQSSNTNGTHAVADCPAQPPTVTSVVYQKDAFRVAGLFDAANSSQLRVAIQNTWYVLGQDSELTAIGNEWVLILDNLYGSVSPGSYAITVEQALVDGTILAGQAQLVIPPKQSPKPPTIKNPKTVPPRAPNTGAIGFARTYMLPTSVISVMVCVAIAGGFVYHKRYKSMT